MDIRNLTAPCGLACFACAIFKDNITDELAEMLGQQFGMTKEEITCHGCRSKSGCSIENVMTNGKGCETKECVDAKGIHNCSECADFPCEKLMPTADMAAQIPHNTKMYNLARIKLIGLEEWAKEAGMIQMKYFKGKFAYGKEPQLQNDTDIEEK